MLVPNRHGGTDYRYGFNGMEKDNEVKGEGNSYTTTWRQYDPRITRWLTIDPKAKRFPSFTPYNNNENNPIINTDPNGDCPWCAVIGAIAGAGIEFAGQAIANYTEGKPVLENIDWADVGIAALEGGINGLTLGAAAPATSIVAGAAKVSVDYSQKNGLETVGGVVGERKKDSKVIGDIAGEAVGVFINTKLTNGIVDLVTDGIVDKTSKKVSDQITKTAADAAIEANSTGTATAVISSKIGGTVEEKAQDFIKSESKRGRVRGNQSSQKSSSNSSNKNSKSNNSLSSKRRRTRNNKK